MAITHLTDGDGDFAAMLRNWRRARGFSQLDLALSIDVSPRHLSFLETGRARPSRDMVRRLGEALMLPRHARNAMLAKAGFSALYPATPLDDDALKPLRAILDEMMRRHAPYPAMICDRRWTILDANESARALLAPLHGPSGEMNIVRMLTQSALAKELIVNYGEVLGELSDRIRLEALEAGPEPAHAALVALLDEAIMRTPAPKSHAPRSVFVPLVLRAGESELRFLSTIAHFGTSEDVTVRDLRLELLFPADETTKAALHAMAA